MARNPIFQAPDLGQAQRTGASYSCPVNGGIKENVTGNIDCTINGGVSGIELCSALALVGAFSVIVKTHCETDGALHSSNQETYKETLMGISMEASLEP